MEKKITQEFKLVPKSLFKSDDETAIINFLKSFNNTLIRTLKKIFQFLFKLKLMKSICVR